HAGRRETHRRTSERAAARLPPGATGLDHTRAARHRGGLRGGARPGVTGRSASVSRWLSGKFQTFFLLFHGRARVARSTRGVAFAMNSTGHMVLLQAAYSQMKPQTQAWLRKVLSD